jgi:hypothetical protein
MGPAQQATSLREKRGTMGRVDADELADGERVFIAGTLREALRVEELLTAEGVDYAVEIEPYGTSLLFSQRNGAAFYVPADRAGHCRMRLTAEGLGRGVVEDRGDRR